MSRNQPVNKALQQDLAQLYGTGPHAQAATRAVLGALGVASAQWPDEEQHPVLGYFFHQDDKLFVLYMVTPGRFIRYEALSGTALTIVVPVHKISRVVETASQAMLRVNVELDAESATSITEYRERADEDDPTVLVGRSESKTLPTVYELVADTAEDVPRLQGFSFAVRNAIGL